VVPDVQPELSLKATGRSRRRLLVNRAAEAGATIAAGVAVLALGVLVWSVFSRGVHALNWSFFTKGPAVFGQTGGGVAPALVGTGLLVAIATAMALPFGVLTAIYVSEFAPRRIAEQIRLWLDVLNGFPSIVIGIFVFELLVVAKLPVIGVGHHQSAWAGGFALSIIMLPLVSRTTMEVLALVPNSLREASYALGISKWRTVLGVVLPSAVGGIVTGTTLAVARAAGETAPLLFVCSIFGQAVSWDPSNSVASVPVIIFEYSEQPDRNLNAQAWAAAFVLIAFVLVTSLVSRVMLERSRRKFTRS
jgi:phosphate transport system permease protein